MDLKQIVLIVAQASIFLTVFGFGLKASFADLLYVVRRPRLLARSLLAVFVIMPLVVFALVKALDFTQTVRVALVALSISPLPPILPRKESGAGWDSSFGLGLMSILATLSIVLVPASLELLELFTGQKFGMAPAVIARVVVISTLLPLVAGVLVHRLLPALTDTLERYATLLARVMLPLAVVALVAGAFPEMWALVGRGAILAIVIFTVFGLGIGHLLAGSDPNHQVVLALSTACRHPAVAFFIAGSNFPDLQFGGIILLYLLVNTLVGIPYLKWQRQRVAIRANRAAEPGSSSVSSHR